ncbi:uncharacterized protein LOC134192034 [Corticium candelabrum]|uniref:uncharacterized protein LOC134192034 n=1 Tax=Corticium candelabrum TaxID=121492 RepID=UPI002E270D9D|nr:uncharacterized protein LOC134192034 [Corticium candelabrum]
MLYWIDNFDDMLNLGQQLVDHGDVHFIVYDYLSEITMSLLTAARNKQPNMGYCPDFVHQAVGPLASQIKTRGIRVVSNAGGVNPHACAKALSDAAMKQGVSFNVAVITGDDLMPQKSAVNAVGVTDIENGYPLPNTVQSMNAYLGAGPIAHALDVGADIVVTGRCVDSALVLGPLMHSFGWKKQQNYHLLAAGSLAGHLVECGAQSTGGIFTDWDIVPNWDNIGFPIVECESNGDFVLTKPRGTGGLVNRGTVAEQLVYEIGDPSAYHLPDVCCDFSNVTLNECPGGNAVSVTGAKGYPPTNFLKVSATYVDGYKAISVFSLNGFRSIEKGHRTAQSILSRFSTKLEVAHLLLILTSCYRVRNIFKKVGFEDFTRVHMQAIGAEECYGQNASMSAKNNRDIVMWLGVQHLDRDALNIFRREIAPAGTGMAPGLSGLVGGRPQVSPVLKLFSFLYPKSKVQAHVSFSDGNEEFVPEVSAAWTTILQLLTIWVIR